MALQLVAIAGPDKGRVFTLNVGTNLMLGRSAQAHYRINDPRVSRNHCQVQIDGDQVVIQSSSASSGTHVNGRPIQQCALKPGDVLQVGDTQLRLEVGDLPLDVALAQSAGAKPTPSGTGKASQLASLVGTELAHYTVNLAIGSGRSCMVFQATDNKDNRPVALKVLQPEFSQDEEEVQRFIRGMKTMLPLRHPNLVTLYGAGKIGPHCWVAMEYIAGENLQQVINRIGVAGMLDWRHAFKVAVNIGRALAYAHEHNVLHRNVTPTNILRDATTRTSKLGDLMLAKALEGPLARQITRPGEIIGDVDYMSPERTRGTEDLDARADLYGLGATVYALLTGRPPCGGSTLVEKISRIRQTEPDKPTRYQRSVPSHFEGVVVKLLAKRPDDRYQSAGELLKELERVGRYCGAPLD